MMEYNPYFMLALILACGGASAVGRHVQGGAGHRWIAMILYGVPSLTILVCYARIGLAADTIRWQVIAAPLALVALFYIYMTFEQKFAQLWSGFARYCVVFFILAGITNCAWVMLFIPPVFFTLKWAREPNQDIADPHQAFEWVLGGSAGAAWAIAALFGGW